MDKLYEASQADKAAIEKLINKISLSLKSAPEGTLKITKKRGHTEYARRISKGAGKVEYIAKNNGELIRALAQKDYDLKILKDLTARKEALEKFETAYPMADLEDIYNRLSPERRALVKPVVLTDEQYRSLWISTPFYGKSFRDDDDRSFYTEKGERVRSKSEVIIANYLFHADIPYKYECPLKLSARTIYPDFTILDVHRRRQFYLEHFGMMDEPGYAENFVEKVALYQSNGIFPGEKLIMTFETANKPLDTRMIRQTMEFYLK